MDLLIWFLIIYILEPKEILKGVP